MNRGVVAQLRDIVPIRPLTRIEAMAIAERQAQMFLKLMGIEDGPVDERVIADLPRVEVRRTSPWPSSGATQWINGRWVVILNSSEPAVRQRFSLAHELKHIIDHRFIDIIYDGIPAEARHAFTESVSDYFAGCLLMPRPWVKRAYSNGIQRLDLLAHQFHVSQAAMATRLSQIGLSEPTPRCARPPKSWARDAIERSGGELLYQRSYNPPLKVATTRTPIAALGQPGRP